MNRRLERQIMQDKGFAKWVLKSFMETMPSQDLENLYIVYKSGMDPKKLKDIPQPPAKKPSLWQRILKR